MSAYYNENDPAAAEWLRRLIAGGHIAPGVVDERDIRDVTPAELTGFRQCHFFAGVGLWSLALRRAGWPDDAPIWTGSCPCQPFSTAGKGGGFDDERHLWPAWHWLISLCRPRFIVGEQVASQDGLGWLDLVSSDMAGIGYAVGAVDLSAAGFGLGWRGSAFAERLERTIRLCPDSLVARQLGSFARWADQALAIGGGHVRQRLYFVGMGDSQCARLEGQRGDGDRKAGRESRQARSIATASPVGGLVDADGGDASQGRAQRGGQQRPNQDHDGIVRGDSRGGERVDSARLEADETDGGRGAPDWLLCRDGNWRPVEAGTFPLANAGAGRMGELRAYGNGLDIEAASAFCEAVAEITGGL